VNGRRGGGGGGGGGGGLGKTTTEEGQARLTFFPPPPIPPPHSPLPPLSFVLGLLGFGAGGQRENWVRIGSSATEEQDGYIANDQVRFEKHGGNETGKEQVFNEVVKKVKESVRKDNFHMVLVMTKKDGERIKKLITEGEEGLTDDAVLFIHADVPRTKEVRRQLQDYKDGVGSLRAMFSTQPITGLNAKHLLELDVLASWNIVCLYQSLTRVARGW